MSQTSIDWRTTIAAALIAALATVISALIHKGYFETTSKDNNNRAENQPTLQRAVLVFESITPLPQRVNEKRIDREGRLEPLTSTEVSAYRIVVSNRSNRSITLRDGEYLVDDVKLPPLGQIIPTTAAISLIDHRGHIEAPIGVPRIGDSIRFSLNITAEPEARREFTVWFRGSDPAAPEFFRLDGRLRIHFEDQSVTSGTLKLELHRESQTMRPAVQTLQDEYAT